MAETGETIPQSTAGENQSPEVVLSPPHSCYGTHIHLLSHISHTYMQAHARTIIHFLQNKTGDKWEENIYNI